MRWAGKTILGISLLLVGLLALFSLGWLIPFAVGAFLVVVGIKKMKRSHGKGNKIWGMILLVIGLLIIGHMIPFLVGLIIAAVCFHFGYKLIKKGGHRPDLDPGFAGTHQSHQTDHVDLEDSFDSEWERFLKKQKKDQF